jgi:lysophospholipase L1-like esterase
VVGPAQAAGRAADHGHGVESRSAALAAVRGLRYVALGDSYASGYGIGPASAGSAPGCGQSAADYPRIVAQALHLRITDVTCAGATTANVISTPESTASGAVAPQSDALGPATRLVTITIGGNDLGFASIVSTCAALTANGPIMVDPSFSSCHDVYVTHGVNSLRARIDGPVLFGSPGEPSGIAATFAKIRAAAPHARVFVVGYPALVPDPSNTPAAGCFRPVLSGSDTKPPYPPDGLPFTGADIAYLSSVQSRLEQGVRSAAHRSGFTYVPLLAGTEAHSACASPDAAFVNGITIDSISHDRAVTTTQGSLHPDPAGVAYAAKVVERAIVTSFEHRAGS